MKTAVVLTTKAAQSPRKCFVGCELATSHPTATHCFIALPKSPYSVDQTAHRRNLIATGSAATKHDLANTGSIVISPRIFKSKLNCNRENAPKAFCYALLLFHNTNWREVISLLPSEIEQWAKSDPRQKVSHLLADV